MNKAEQAAQALADMGATLLDCPQLKGSKALCAPGGYVALGRVENSQEAHTVLAHEKWHLKLGVFYSAQTPAAERARAEARVHRQLILELVPRAALAGLLRQGLGPSEVAERLDVTEQLVLEAYWFYKNADPGFCSG